VASQPVEAPELVTTQSPFRLFAPFAFSQPSESAPKVAHANTRTPATRSQKRTRTGRPINSTRSIAHRPSNRRPYLRPGRRQTARAAIAAAAKRETPTLIAANFIASESRAMAL